MAGFHTSGYAVNALRELQAPHQCRNGKRMGELCPGMLILVNREATFLKSRGTCQTSRDEMAPARDRKRGSGRRTATAPAATLRAAVHRAQDHGSGVPFLPLAESGVIGARGIPAEQTESIHQQWRPRQHRRQAGECTYSVSLGGDGRGPGGFGVDTETAHKPVTRRRHVAVIARTARPGRPYPARRIKYMHVSNSSGDDA